MIVVVGVDGSPLSSRVLEHAVAEARWRGAELRVVHVNYLPVVYSEVAVDWSAVAEAQRKTVWGHLEEPLAAIDVPLERVDLTGYPPDALVDYADSVEADLLVVGTRGRGDLASLILGSTSHRAIHLARCDVMVVKPQAGSDLAEGADRLT